MKSGITCILLISKLTQFFLRLETIKTFIYSKVSNIKRKTTGKN